MAFRRLRARPGTFAAMAVALGGAVALIGWSSPTAAERLRLGPAKS